jgi:anti-anti-sigma regulatory factor
VVAAIRDVTERRAQELRLERQRDEILELSTPVIQVWDKVLALPIIGTLDSGRAARLTEGLLEKIAESQAEVIILDISGVPTIDTQVAQHLLKTVQAATLMGAASIMSGVRPETAQAMVHLGIDMGQLRSRSTLRDALQLAMQTVRDRASLAAAAATTAAADGVQ